MKVHADVSKEEGIQAIMDTALEHFGTVDVFVNNSGFNGEEAMPHEMTLEQWQKVIDVNITGAFLGAKAAIAYMMEHDIKGSILNISSVHQEIPRPFNVHYSTSKGGMNMMTKTLALDYAEAGIRVNAIAPGTMATESNDDHCIPAEHDALICGTKSSCRSQSNDWLTALNYIPLSIMLPTKNRSLSFLAVRG